MSAPFGIDPVGVMVGLNIVLLIGWTYTLWKYRQALGVMHLSTFWWEWWVETATRHGIQLGEADLTAVDELAPEDSPSLMDQVGAVTETPEQHVPTEVEG